LDLAVVLSHRADCLLDNFKSDLIPSYPDTGHPSSVRSAQAQVKREKISNGPHTEEWRANYGEQMYSARSR